MTVPAHAAQACPQDLLTASQPWVLDAQADPLANQTFEPFVGCDLAVEPPHPLPAHILRAALHPAGITDLLSRSVN